MFPLPEMLAAIGICFGLVRLIQWSLREVLPDSIRDFHQSMQSCEACPSTLEKQGNDAGQAIQRSNLKQLTLDTD